jgi:hypothetical protein
MVGVALRTAKAQKFQCMPEVPMSKVVVEVESSETAHETASITREKIQNSIQ